MLTDNIRADLRILGMARLREQRSDEAGLLQHLGLGFRVRHWLSQALFNPNTHDSRLSRAVASVAAEEILALRARVAELASLTTIAVPSSRNASRRFSNDRVHSCVPRARCRRVDFRSVLLIRCRRQQ